ncbi:MAG TPA: FAD-dependent monooxygenase [Rhodanobacteraceae bacterium]|nr:FAD-dependent monooxygenase [Rhodanobacteraceae bacterium]
MNTRHVLISGAGIAGPSLAYWLLKRGFAPTLVEQAPAPRGGGYMIDVWGVGWKSAERMGLLPRILRDGYRMDGLSIVNRHGRQVARMDSRHFGEALDGNFISLLRGDLAMAIHARIDGKAEMLFDDGIEAIDQDDTGVNVTFRHAAPRRFDLVIGADGLHSRVRELVFGPHARFERSMGLGTASFIVPDYPHRDETRYVSYCVPGRQVARYALRDNRTAFFFVFADPDGQVIAQGRSDPRAALAQLYAHAGWECADITHAMQDCEELYFDSVNQVHMPHWHRGRVALLGDAAFCPSLLAGEGSAFAMLGAYVLAGELQQAEGHPATAFAAYEGHLQAYLRRKQKAAARLGHWFVPTTRPGVLMRNLVTTLANTPPFSRWILRDMINDGFVFPAYAAT